MFFKFIKKYKATLSAIIGQILGFLLAEQYIGAHFAELLLGINTTVSVAIGIKKYNDTKVGV